MSATATKPTPLNEKQKTRILKMLDKTQDSQKIADKVGVTRQQVAAIKAWKTMGKF